MNKVMKMDMENFEKQRPDFRKMVGIFRRSALLFIWDILHRMFMFGETNFYLACHKFVFGDENSFERVCNVEQPSK